MNRNVVGGAACPPSIIRDFKDNYACDTIHAWGCLKPVHSARSTNRKQNMPALSAEEFEKLRLTQGRPPFGVEFVSLMKAPIKS
jgi:fatty-acyl-CoA synthase